MSDDHASRRPAPAFWPVVGALLALPLLLGLARAWGPWADALQGLSYDAAPAFLRPRIGEMLLVPFGALVVVLVRLTLGIRVLGPFRSVLLAFAFLGTGVWLGVLFLGLTVLVVLGVRPVVRALALPYFGRVSVLLSAVALLVVVGTLVGVRIGSQSLESVAFFPVVVVCLIGEAIARTIREEGVRSGVWRAGATTLAAVAVAELAAIPGFVDLLLSRPELILVGVAGIAIASRFLAFRLLAGMNPAPVRRRRARRAGAPSSTPRPDRGAPPSAAAGAESLDTRLLAARERFRLAVAALKGHHA